MPHSPLKDSAPAQAIINGTMLAFVTQDILPGMSWQVWREGKLLNEGAVGWADCEAQKPLRNDAIFRVFSNTKLFTSVAALLLLDEGRIGLDDPVDRYLPGFTNPRTLKPDALSLSDTEATKGQITLRQLLTHSGGLSYGLLDPGSILYNAYTAKKILKPSLTNAQMCAELAQFPLRFQPGSSFEYSLSLDVVGRVIEVVSGQTLEEFFQTRLFTPLGLLDTGFTVPAQKWARFTALYAGVNPLNPLQPGLIRVDDRQPWPNAYAEPVPRQAGGGGLVSTLADMSKFMHAVFSPGGTYHPSAQLLKPETRLVAMRNQLAPGVVLNFPMLGPIASKGHGLLGAVSIGASSLEPPQTIGEVQWGGLAGTQWSYDPHSNLTLITMTHKMMAFWHPAFFSLKQMVHHYYA